MNGCAFTWPSSHAQTTRALAREKDEFEAQEDLGRDAGDYRAEADAARRELVAADAAYEASR